MPDDIEPPEPSGAQKAYGDFAPALAFYAGWPKAMSAMAVAKRIFRGGGDH